MNFDNYEKVLKRTFFCPICNKEIERINEYLARCTIQEQLEKGLSNKRFHFSQHRKEKRKQEKIDRKNKFGRHSG